MGGCLIDWDRLPCVKFMIRWCFSDGPFPRHGLRRLVNSRRIGSFDGVHGPRDSRCAMVPRIWSSGGDSVANMTRVLLMRFPRNVMLQWYLRRVVRVQQNSLRL